MAYPKQQLVDLILAKADLVGPRNAIEQGDHSINYTELRELVRHRTEMLTARGASGAFVAVEKRKSPDFVVDFLAILSAGGVVVPLDPQMPPERRKTFLDLVPPRLIVGEAGIEEPGHAAAVPEEGGWVFFTSGSTGLPKPVLGSVVGLRSFVDWFGPEFDVRPADRFSCIAGVSFEASLRDIFAPLAAGATLVLPTDDDTASPDATVAWLARAGISVVTVVPSVARGWLRHAGTVCSTVRAAFFIGEPVAGDILAGWRTTFPATTVLVNSYGSTESGQGTVFRRIIPGDQTPDPVPAGRPVPGTRFCLIPPDASLDADLVRRALDHPQDSGEIVIVSSALSLGYLCLPEHNRARFVSLGAGVAGYRTGDLGRVDGDGELTITGRADDEVKINGVRVHPNEVTRALRGRKVVADAFVTATRTGGSASLTGYVVPNGPLSIPDLRRDLMEALPLAMIPARFVELAELPRTRTGKVDRAALTAMAGQAVAAHGTSDQDVPSGDVECWLADQLTDLLDIDLLDIDRPKATDDVFALGCDSVTAASLASRIEREYGVRIPVLEIFVAATVRGIAAVIDEWVLLAADPAELEALLDALEADAGRDTHAGTGNGAGAVLA